MAAVPEEENPAIIETLRYVCPHNKVVSPLCAALSALTHRMQLSAYVGEIVQSIR